MKQVKLTAKIKESLHGLFSIETNDRDKADIQAVLKLCKEKYNGYLSLVISTPARKKTLAQNNAFHSILAEFWKSGLHSYSSKKVLKIYMKTCDLTQCFDSYEKDGQVFNVIKSMEFYTLEESKNALDYIISTCIQAGLNTRKFDEILRGMKQ